MRTLIGWGLLALIIYLFATYPTLYVMGGLALLFVVAQATFSSIDSWKRRRLEKARNKDAVEAASLFWLHAFRWENSGYGIDPNKLGGFKSMVKTLLAKAHVETGLMSYPEIGIFYHRPHCFGICPLLERAGETVHIAYGGILECSLPHVHMRISDERIEVTGTLGCTEWKEVWRKGESFDRITMAGHRWSGCQCGKPEHAALTTEHADPLRGFRAARTAQAPDMTCTASGASAS